MPPAARDVEALARQRWDLLVIGGGIHGLFAAYDAAQRGLSVALVDGADFGSGLSFNHQRTLHGGLRALHNGQLGKTRQQVNERRTWARIAPHLVRPLPFLVGTYAGTSRSRPALRLGFALYDLVGRDRDAGVPVELHLPHARLESATTTRKLFPGISETGLTGGAIQSNRHMAALYDYDATLEAMRAIVEALFHDPSYPAERLAFMLEDSGARVLVTHRGLRAVPEAAGS
jgi:glycerol-3-phosphate dehydrogenase